MTPLLPIPPDPWSDFEGYVMFAELEVEGVVDTPGESTLYGELGPNAEIDTVEKVRTEGHTQSRPTDDAAPTS